MYTCLVQGETGTPGNAGEVGFPGSQVMFYLLHLLSLVQAAPDPFGDPVSDHS